MKCPTCGKKLSLRLKKASTEFSCRNDADGNLPPKPEHSHDYIMAEVDPVGAYIAEPLFAVNAETLMEQWEEDDLNWVLSSYPVMPDGTVLVNFTAEKEDGTECCRTAHLENSAEGAGYAVLKIYEADLRSFGLGTTAVKDGELWAALVERDTMRYVMQKIAPWDESTRYDLGYEIHSMVWQTFGAPAVAYHSNMRSGNKAPFAIFDENGVADFHRKELALECRDVNLDDAGTVWAYIYPGKYLTGITKDGEKKYVKFDMQGFDAFAFSQDSSILITFFNRFADECRIYVQHKRGSGEVPVYDMPIPFCFQPYDEEGNLVNIEKCSVYGQVSSNKDRFILRTDNRLHYYTADTFAL